MGKLSAELTGPSWVAQSSWPQGWEGGSHMSLSAPSPHGLVAWRAQEGEGDSLQGRRTKRQDKM